MAKTVVWYPPLENLGLPNALINAVRKAYSLIYGVQAQVQALTAVYAEVPEGTVDSSNKHFVLAFAPNPAESLLLFQRTTGGSLLQTEGTDYGLSGRNIVFGTAPTDALTAYYTRSS